MRMTDPDGARTPTPEARREHSQDSPLAPRPRPRGRPALMSPGDVLEKIRRIAREGALYRVHRLHGGLYARARRQFGTWEGAVRAAGVDYVQAISIARRRSIETRRRQRRQRARAGA